MNINKLKDFMFTSVYFLAVIVLAFLIIKYVGQRTEVVGRSMEPTLENEDNLIVDKISYRFKEPERYDIIVFPYRDGSGMYYIKRIIGLPGEQIYINERGDVFVDGKKLEEPYIKEKAVEAGLATNIVNLGDDEYFVLGDNRNNSTDSRSIEVGNVKRDEIIGKAGIRIWPFDKIQLLKYE